MKLNLTKFKMFTSIRKDAMVEVNIKNEVVDVMYKNVTGMVAHALTHKLYEADGEVELNDNEVAILDALMAKSSVMMIDSWNYFKDNQQ